MAQHYLQSATAQYFNSSALDFYADFGYASEAVSWSASGYVRRQSSSDDYILGGPILRNGAPPTTQSESYPPGDLGVRIMLISGTVQDFLVWADITPNVTVYEYSTMAFVYVSLRNDTLRLDPTLNFALPRVQTVNISDWVWDSDPSQSELLTSRGYGHLHLSPNDVCLSALEEQHKNAKLQTMEFTVYIYPMACSMYSDPATARIRGDGVLLSTNFTTRTSRSATPDPFNRPLPVQETELLWANVTAVLRQIQFSAVSRLQNWGGTVELTWLENTLLDRIVNATGISAMEDSLSYITALSYALLAQSWRTQNAQGGSAAAKLSQTWMPQDVLLSGTQYLLFARLRISGPQLIIAFVSTIVLVVVSLITTVGHAGRFTDPIIRNGGVIDLFSMLAGSELPALIAVGVDDFAAGRDGQRAQAERTIVKYVSTRFINGG